MKTTSLRPWWRKNHPELRFWIGFLGLLALPTAISLAGGLMPLWIVAGTVCGLLFFTGLLALIGGAARPRA